MTVTIELDMTELYDGDSNSNWQGDDTVSTYDGIQREGTDCLGSQVSQGVGEFWLSGMAAKNLENTHIYSWMMANGTPDTIANGGFRIGVGDGTNRVFYYVGGSDSYGFAVGAWFCFVMDTANPPTGYHEDAGSEGSLDWTNIQEVGVGFDIVNKAVGTVDNCFWDICRYGNGLIVGGSDAGNPGTFAEIVADDESTSAGKAYGIIRELQAGVYGVQGKLIFGSTTTGSHFQDENAIIVWEDRLVAEGHYEIYLTGDSSYTNTFILGEKAGEAGIKGCIFKSAGSVKGIVDLSDANFDEMKVYAGSFLDASGITFPGYDSGNKEVYSVAFDSSNEVIADTITLKSCQFINSDQRALRLQVSGHHAEDLTFISCPTGVHITGISGTYEMDFDNFQFSNCDADLENAIVSGIVTGNMLNGSNASTFIHTEAGTGTIVNPVTVAITIKDAGGTPISGARVRVDNTGYTVNYFNGMTDAAGEVGFTVNYVDDVDINTIIRRSPQVPNLTRYYPQNNPGVIQAGGFSATYTMIEDTIAILPSAVATSWADPTEAENIDQGKVNWTTVWEATGQSDDYAECTLDSHDYSNILVVSGFEFSIPDGATITGIIMEIDRHDSFFATSDYDVRLISGSSHTKKGTNQYDSGVGWPATDTDAYKSYGSSGYTWGWTDITRDDVNDGHFGISFEAYGFSQFFSFPKIDHIRLKIIYY